VESDPAVVCLNAVTAALQLWGGSRRVAHLERQRTALQPAVAPFLARRDSLVSVLDAGAQLSRSRAQAPWGARLLVLAEALPDDAWFTAFRAAGDSVLVEGSAAEAASVLDQLRRAPGVRDVRSSLTTATGADARESFAAVVHFHAASAP
jgi:Tfp pilus assembly protein PilN